MSKEDGKGTLVVTYREDEGEVDRRRLAGVLGAATTVMMLILIVALSLGMVGAALGVGMGGFVASFGNVQSTDGGTIYPVLGEQPACEEAPQLKASLRGTAEITEHVAFYKDLPAPGVLNVSTVRINIVSELDGGANVTADNLDLRLSALAADELVLDSTANSSADVKISEYREAVNGSAGNTAASDSYGVDSNNNPQTLRNASAVSSNVEFGITIPKNSDIIIDNGTSAAHQVAFETISVPGVDLFITMGNESDFTSAPGDTGIDDRSVGPAERVCSALANASSPDTYNGTYPDS